MSRLIDEANRCLTCKNARCSKACPISTVIPEIIELYKKGDLDQAGKVLFENNPLSSICSIVCPHEDNCVGNCIMGIRGDSIDFPSIEREISENFLNETELEKEEINGKKIAIIGSGPAGLTLAFIMAQKGYSVTIFEKNSKLGGVLRYGIPEFRLPKAILDTMETRLLELGVRIRYNDLIGPVNNVEQLLKDGYDVVFIGTGVWNPKPLRIKGEMLGHVNYAINYLKSPETFKLGKKVIVIGAGNVAMDAARTAKRQGADEVIVVYRRTEEDMKATKAEIEETKKDGVRFLMNTSPVKIIDQGIVVEKTEEIITEGKKSLVIKNESEYLLKCDTIIVAISQDPSNNIVSNTKENIEVDRYGLVIIDDSGQTTTSGVFASGDVVTGAKTVVEAVVHTKKVALAIEEYISREAK